jgi:hypothetical protein
MRMNTEKRGFSFSGSLSVLLLMLLPLLLFAPVVFGPKTLIPADALFLFEPFRSAATDLGVTVPQNPLLADLILENYVWKRLCSTPSTTGNFPSGTRTSSPGIRSWPTVSTPASTR